jgi:glucose/arabinose dehydrogenase
MSIMQKRRVHQVDLSIITHVSLFTILTLGTVFNASAATFADPKFTETVVATNLSPTAMAIAPDGRIFVCNKNGTLRVVKNGTLLAKPFITLPVITPSEQGLLGVTLHPKFPDSAFIYLFYTLAGPDHNRVSRFRVDGDTALGGLAGETIIFDMDVMTAGNHNGGAIHFGNDGKLYISAGNSATSVNSLSMTTTLGKILRVNADGSIPSDNPFLDKTTGKAQAIWCAGMRNTFTFDVDKVSGRIFGAEVGDGWEEVNELLGGSNYGYGRQEGYTIPTNTAGIVGTFQPAIYTYDGGGCIIAAAFYPGTGTRNFPAAFHRQFFFADHRNHTIKTLDIDAPKSITAFATDAMGPVDIKFGADGTMYYLNRNQSGGSLLKVTYAGGPVGLGSTTKQKRMPQGWELKVGRQGNLIGLKESKTSQIIGLNGKAMTPPSHIPDGLYFVKSK